MNQKILTKIATVAEKDEDLIEDDSVIVCLTLNRRIRDSLFRASNLICELEHSDYKKDREKCNTLEETMLKLNEFDHNNHHSCVKLGAIKSIMESG